MSVWVLCAATLGPRPQSLWLHVKKPWSVQKASRLMCVCARRAAKVRCFLKVSVTKTRFTFLGATEKKEATWCQTGNDSQRRFRSAWNTRWAAVPQGSRTRLDFKVEIISFVFVFTHHHTKSRNPGEICLKDDAAAMSNSISNLPRGVFSGFEELILRQRKAKEYWGI